MSRTLSWGIFGTGRIAGIFANGVKQSQTGTLAAVGSRSQAAADTFGETWHIPHRYSRYEDVLADQSVQAVYVALPHPFHAEWPLKRLRRENMCSVRSPLRSIMPRLWPSSRRRSAMVSSSWKPICIVAILRQRNSWN